MQQVGSALGEAQSMRCIRYIARAFRRNHPRGLETLSSCLCIACLSPVPTNQINQMHSRTHTHTHIHVLHIYVYMYIYILYSVRYIRYDIFIFINYGNHMTYQRSGRSKQTLNTRRQIVARLREITKIQSKYLHCQTVVLKTYSVFQLTTIYPEYLEIDILSINSSNFFYSLLPCFEKLSRPFKQVPLFVHRELVKLGSLESASTSTDG